MLHVYVDGEQVEIFSDTSLVHFHAIYTVLKKHGCFYSDGRYVCYTNPRELLRELVARSQFYRTQIRKIVVKMKRCCKTKILVIDLVKNAS